MKRPVRILNAAASPIRMLSNGLTVSEINDINVLQLKVSTISAIDQIGGQLILPIKYNIEPKEDVLYVNLSVLLELLCDYSELNLFNFRIHRAVCNILNSIIDFVPVNPYFRLQLLKTMERVDKLKIDERSEGILNNLRKDFDSSCFDTYINNKKISPRNIFEIIYTIEELEKGKENFKSLSDCCKNKSLAIIASYKREKRRYPVKDALELGLLDGIRGLYRIFGTKGELL